MGKWKALIPITMALVIAASGSFFVYKWLQTQTAQKQTTKVQFDSVSVAVATADLPWGTKLKQEMIKTVSFPKESLPEGYFSNPGAVVGRVVLTSIKKNVPIIESVLAPDTVTVGGVSAIVKPGKRAIAVKGDKVIGLSGFINPANRVDVLVTIQNPTTKKEITKIVLENILVLATGSQMQVNNKGEPAPVDVYTLEVTPEEGEKLALAATKGKLQFALRNFTDSETVVTQGATISQTLNSCRGAQIPAKSKNTKWIPPENTCTVEVIKGNDVSRKKMKL